MPSFLSQVLDTLISVTYVERFMMSDMQPRPIVLESLESAGPFIDKLTDELQEIVGMYQIDVTRDQLIRCVEHLCYVEQVNRYINLTRISDMEDALVLHILDSLLFLPYLGEEPGSFLDIGTGAGYPGIPLALCSSLTGVLLDSVGKKIRAVQAFSSELNLPSVLCVHDRVEDYARSHRDSFTYVVARAVAPISVLIEYAAPLLCKMGSLVISKGQLTQDELDIGLRTARLCGFELVEHDTRELPRDMGHRELLVFKKIRPSSVKLPRATGLARKQPLV